MLSAKLLAATSGVGLIGAEWQDRFFRANINSIAWSSSLSLFIAVGRIGSVYTSPNGTTWTQQNIGATVEFKVAVWTGTAFCIAGGGEAWRSTDGVSWTQTSSAMGNINAMAVGTGLILAVGDTGVARTSSDDGQTWATLATGTTNNLTAVAWRSYLGANRFVAVGGTGGTTVFYGDGTYFGVSFGFFTVTMVAVAYTTLNGFVAANNQGTLWFSSDGSSFTQTGYSIPVGADNVVSLYRATNDHLYATATNGSEAGSVFQNSDPTFWSWGSSLSTERVIKSIADAGTQGVGVGNGFCVVKGGLSNSITTWTSQNQSRIFNINGIAASSTRIVCVGDDGDVTYSDDLVTWNPPSMTTTSNKLRSIAWSPTLNLFVAVGDSSTIITSSDGNTWFASTSPTTANWVAITWDVNLSRFWLIPSNKNQLYESSDGINWSFRFTIGSTTNWLANGITTQPSGNRVAISRGTAVWYSTSVLTNSWSSVSVGTENANISFNGSRYVLTGGTAGVPGTSTIFTSSTGSTWTTRTPGTTQKLYASVAEIPYATVAVGGENTTSVSDSIVYSTDYGVTWYDAYGYNKNNKYRAVTYFSAIGRYVAAGVDGQISISNSIPGLQTTI